MTRLPLALLLTLLGASLASAPSLQAQDGRGLCRVGGTVEVFIDQRWWEGEVAEGPTADGTCGVTHRAYFGVANTGYYAFDLLRPVGTDPASTGPVPTSPLCIVGEQVAVRVASGWHRGTVIGKHPTDGACTVRHEAYGVPLDHQVEPDDVGPVERALKEEPATPPAPAATPPASPRQPQASPRRPDAPPVPRETTPAAPTPAPAATVPAGLPDGRYICNQGGLTRRGTLHWGYFDLSGGRAYRPLTGSGGTYRYDGRGIVEFQGGIFERYDWVGVARERRDGVAEITLVERVDLEAFRAGRPRGNGSGIAVICGYDGTR